MFLVGACLQAIRIVRIVTAHCIACKQAPTSLPISLIMNGVMLPIFRLAPGRNRSNGFRLEWRLDRRGEVISANATGMQPSDDGQATAANRDLLYNEKESSPIKMTAAGSVLRIGEKLRRASFPSNRSWRRPWLPVGLYLFFAPSDSWFEWPGIAGWDPRS